MTADESIKKANMAKAQAASMTELDRRIDIAIEKFRKAIKR